MEKMDWNKVMVELENNEEAISNLADQIFGSVEDLTKGKPKDKLDSGEEGLLNERAIFYKEGLKFMNELSLLVIKNDLR